MIENFVLKGKMRLDEKGQLEIVDPRILEQAISPKIVSKQQQ